MLTARLQHVLISRHPTMLPAALPTSRVAKQQLALVLSLADCMPTLEHPPLLFDPKFNKARRSPLTPPPPFTTVHAWQPIIRRTGSRSRCAQSCTALLLGPTALRGPP